MNHLSICWSAFHQRTFQVGNLGSLFFLLFFIFAALGVELFGKLGRFLVEGYIHLTTNDLLVANSGALPSLQSALRITLAMDWASMRISRTLEWPFWRYFGSPLVTTGMASWRWDFRQNSSIYNVASRISCQYTYSTKNAWRKWNLHHFRVKVCLDILLKIIDACEAKINFSETKTGFQERPSCRSLRGIAVLN